MKALLTLASLALASHALAFDFDGGTGDFGNIFDSRCVVDGANVTINTYNGPTLTLRNMAHAAPTRSGDTVTIPAPAGVVTRNDRAVPLPPLADLVVNCETGAVQGDVQLDSIPMLGTADANDPRQDAIDAFGSVGLDIDPGGVRASIGWAQGRDIPDALGPKDPNAWYLYLDAAIESTDISYDAYQLELGKSLQLSWWLDPQDPAIYAGVRGSIMGDATGGYLSGVGVGFSNGGNLHWTPTVSLRGRNGTFDPQLTGHVAVEAKVSIQPYPKFPLKLTIDGDWMFDMGENFRYSDAMAVARAFLRSNGRDDDRVRLTDLEVQPRFGANVRQMSLDIEVLSINLGKASVFIEQGGAYFRADPAELGIASVFATVAQAASDKKERARRLLDLMSITDVREMYGYVERISEDERAFAVGMIADVGFGGCFVEGAHIRVSDEGIDVTHDGADCVFDDWARQAVADMCALVDAEMDACQAAADGDACDFECDWDAQACYNDCRAEGYGNARCKIRCEVPEFGCLVVEGGELACEAALEACNAIDDFCEGFEVDPNAPAEEPVEPVEQPVEEPVEVPAQHSCTTIAAPDGWIVTNTGDRGCGNWARIANGFRATGSHGVIGQPNRGSLLVKRTSIPQQQRGAIISVDVNGSDDGVAGVVFGYQSGTAYNLAIIDDAANRVQVWQRADGRFTKLHEAIVAIDLRAGHTIDVVRRGGLVIVRVDGVDRVTTLATANQWGRYGVYSSDNTAMNFTHLTFKADCDTNLWGSWTMVNLGTDGCGYWDKQDGKHVAGGMLRINGQRPKFGSLLLRKNMERAGGSVQARIQGTGNHVAGLVIDHHATNDGHFYTFAVLDDRDNTVELWHRTGNSFQRLRRVGLNINFDAGHTLKLSRTGTQVTVTVDGTPRVGVDLAQVLHPMALVALEVPGRRGLYSYAQSHVAFSDVRLP